MNVLFLGNRSGVLRPKRSRIAVVAVGGVALALVLPSYANAAYGWPVKPFNRQHPVRGQLNDPRMNDQTCDSSTSCTFHSGVDIATRDGAAVYAVAAGRVHYIDQSAIAVRRPDVAVVFEYWHIVPLVRDKARVKRHALLGYVEQGRGHVHFAQKMNRIYVNPLRRGGITPYVDSTPPTINSISYYDGADHGLENAVVSGKIRIIVNAYDTPELRS
ncbi:MAG: peptidoglycan DD-metalloendopeptidase family protein, partial [Gaiellaceae bacterium]